MKTTLFFLAAAVTLACTTSSKIAAQSFTLSLTPAETIMAVGDSAVFSLQIQPEGGFDASVFLSAECTHPGVYVTLSKTVVNAPYAAVTITVRAMSDTGTATLKVKGENSNLLQSAQSIIRVKKNALWKVVSTLPEAYRWGTRIIRGNAGSVIGISRGAGSDIILNTYNDGAWHTDKVVAKGFSDPEGGARYEYAANGTLWAVSTGALYRFQNGLATVWSSSDSIGGVPIDFILDADGSPLVRTAVDNKKISLMKFSGGQWHELHSSDYWMYRDDLYYPSNICRDSAGNIWTTAASAKQKGVIRYNTGRTDLFTKGNFGGDSIVRSVFCDRKGKVWCIHGSTSGYASVFDGQSWSRVEYPNTNKTLAIEVDSKNNIWIGSDRTLYRYDGAEWTEYTSTNSPISAMIQCLVADGSDNIWVAYNRNNSTSIGLARAGCIFNPNGLKGIPIVLSAEEPPAEAQQELSITPNPASESFTVHFQPSHPLGASGSVSVTIRDVFGRAVLTGAGGDTFSTVGLAAGVYFVESAAGGRKYLEKVIIHR